MERLHKIKKAARRLGTSERYLRNLYRTGQLQVVRFGRAVRIPEREVARLCRRGVGR